MQELKLVQDGLVNLSGAVSGNIDKSRTGYSDLVAYFGGVDNLPTSIIPVKRLRPDAAVDEHGARRSYKGIADAQDRKNTDIRSKTLRKLKRMVGWTGSRKGTLSTFSPALCRKIVLFYTNPGDKVVDPFAGHNSRMEPTVMAGRHYYGQDLSHSFMLHNEKRAEELRKVFPDAKIKLHEGDSREMLVPDNFGDFTITSPPYWNIEMYGPEKEQLGRLPGGYQGFLDGLGAVLKENFRVLKPGAYCVWFVNDFRFKGKFYPYHNDTINLGIAAGFIMHDITIVDYGRSQASVFYNNCFKNKILPKEHEYGIVFRKPLAKA